MLTAKMRSDGRDQMGFRDVDLGKPHEASSRLQLFANAAIAASRVGSREKWAVSDVMDITKCLIWDAQSRFVAIRVPVIMRDQGK